MSSVVYQCKWLGDPANRVFDVGLTPKDQNDAALLDQNVWHLAAEGFVTAAYDYYAHLWEDSPTLRVEVVSATGQRRIFDVEQRREVQATVVGEIEAKA